MAGNRVLIEPVFAGELCSFLREILVGAGKKADVAQQLDVVVSMFPAVALLIAEASRDGELIGKARECVRLATASGSRLASPEIAEKSILTFLEGIDAKLAERIAQ